MRGGRKPAVYSAFLAVLLAFILAAGPAGAKSAADPVKERKPWFSLPGIYQIGLIEIDYPIYDSRFLVRQIQRFERNPLIRALVLRIDSPGGGVGATQEVVTELRKFREGGNQPRYIVASFGGVAASGAYYIACMADRIYTNPGALTGSIGVVMEFPDAEDLLKKIGVKYVVVKSGRYKDTGSFARGLSEDEQLVLQDTINDVYEQFFDAVWEGRREALRKAAARGAGGVKVTDADAKARLRRVADGRVMSGRQALKAGLVDAIGGLDDALDEAARLGGAKRRHVVRAERLRQDRGIFDLIGGYLNLPAPGSMLNRRSGISLQYLLR
jgi:protease-4